MQDSFQLDNVILPCKTFEIFPLFNVYKILKDKKLKILFNFNLIGWN